ncbi:hypothetical protein [Myxosarcina sp. GI1]|uniref:hypothetical protein n=1 Tax=Myxosarcina sp. GI1 TaxID=1541065 RepID=UPI00155A45F4|nr:hypothetical protein [Myxosarcina sp. GI1]
MKKKAWKAWNKTKYGTKNRTKACKRIQEKGLIESNYTQTEPYESDYLTSANLETTFGVARRKTKFPRFVSHCTTKGKDN